MKWNRFPLFILLLFPLSSCSWYGGDEEHALYEATFDMWTAGNKLNANYIYPDGSSIEGYIDYRPYFKARSEGLSYWKLDYSGNATMLTTLKDGTSYSITGTYFSKIANQGTILVTANDGSLVTLTWNSQETCPNCLANYIEFYLERTYYIPELGKDLDVWMLYHNRRN